MQAAEFNSSIQCNDTTLMKSIKKPEPKGGRWMSQSFNQANVVRSSNPKLQQDKSSVHTNVPVTKKARHSDSIPRKSASHSQCMLKSNTIPTETSVKNIQSESFESVRSKMRESLVASLTLESEKNKADTIDEAQTTISEHKTCTETEQSQLEYGMLGEKDGIFSDVMFMKDDLLQGNGLSWALETAEDHQLEQVMASPQDIASRIEAELFNLFGSVNKKYREKGRSLLFNLKDRSNPELREKVVTGEISPQRLCTMSAEDLASKELSQWRIAKAEELAQMVVLPDEAPDVKRLVKKTHKGEVQVEVEQGDNLSVEVAVGAAPLTRAESVLATVMPAKRASESKGGSGDVSIPVRQGSDKMNGISMDEFKDEDLPPIVSLDEFMDSLASEPPFENLRSLDADKTVEKSASVLEETLNGAITIPPPVQEKAEEPKAERSTEQKADDDVPGERDGITGEACRDECIWEGVLQLNISSTVNVIGIYGSGERMCSIEWPSCIEIKGRVRLDAFQKFMHELPNSRSRTVMVVRFVCKELSSEGELIFSEVVESYVMDERLGYAEPSPGIEIYFCPVRRTFLALLREHLPNEYSQTLNTEDSLSFIGVVVWRKQSSTISPKNSSHHKHNSSKKQRHLEKKSKIATEASKSNTSTVTNSSPIMDDDTEVPPGFGPSKNEDDLPEFDFESAAYPSLQKHQVETPNSMEQMRQLVLKYGSAKANAVPAWADDDDIPEWQPPRPVPPPPNYPRPAFVAPPVHQLVQPNQPLMPVGPPPGFYPRPIMVSPPPRPPGSFGWGKQ